MSRPKSWRESIRQNLQTREADALLRKRRTLDSPQGVHVQVDGRTLVNFCSNDYLGFAQHPRMITAVQQATAKWGAGSGASHLVCGHQRPHQEAEERLASYVGAESALLFSTGYMANLAVPAAFLGRDDLILEDRLNHASLIDAARLCRASLWRYPHMDTHAYAQRARDHDSGRVMINTDAVFSMDGDIAPVNTIAELVQEIDGLALFDDAHGFGVLGGGRGTLAAHGLVPEGSTLMLGTLGKAMGSAGAFVAGDSELIEFLMQYGRTYIYTTALPPAVAAGICTALDLLDEEPQRRQQLFDHVDFLRSSLETAGIKLPASSTAIQPVPVGSAERALKIADQLEQRGLLISAIRPPTVPVGTARLRITLSADHQQADLDLLVSSLIELLGN